MVANKSKITAISIETLILIAVWKQPFIFQGCFRLTEDASGESILYLFRCQYSSPLVQDTIDSEFSSYDYQFTHLYNETSFINLENDFPGFDEAIYILKYALHQSLWTMLTRSRHRSLSVDDMAMKALYKKIEPILHQAKHWEQLEDDIGFAASISFCPQEPMGKRALEVLLNGLNRLDKLSRH
ncbi:hypothetical protein B1207_00555 [Legionella quinlivanii]|uniref:Uncharacterized protein n=1 Tax=Legionella quinlivanii TaxID=45073 RepID=A0A364LMX8_9GAMM|nr:hypothetical protein [Legionella quinlivanii]RAP38414.1 hypothetical protein B1207_00555 [Legionella quinlivanii]